MDFLEYGKIINTHGIRGELKVDVYCDDFIADQIDEVFIDGAKHEIVSVRYHKGFALVTFKDISDLNQAMTLKNKLMMFDKACVELPEGEYFIADLIGFDVFDRRTQKNIGKLKRVDEMPASRVYAVAAAEGKEVLIPDVEAFVKEIDFEGKTVFVETIYGMLPDEN